LSIAQNRLKTDILSEAIPRILAKRSEERVVRLPPDPPSTRPTIKNPDFQPPAPAKQSLQKWRNEVRDELSIAVFEPKTDMPSEAIPPKMAKFGEAPLNVERDLSGYWRE